MTRDHHLALAVTAVAALAYGSACSSSDSSNHSVDSGTGGRSSVGGVSSSSSSGGAGTSGGSSGRSSGTSSGGAGASGGAATSGGTSSGGSGPSGGTSSGGSTSGGGSKPTGGTSSGGSGTSGGGSGTSGGACTVGSTKIGYTCQFDWSATMGPYILYNNWWGATGATGQQCIWGTCQNGDVIGWVTNWSWNGGTGSVLTYGSVVFGWHYGWPVPNTGLPIPVTSTKAVNCGWDFTLTQTSGAFDVVYDVWLHPTANAPTENPPYTDGGQSDEVMIWLNQAGNPAPAGPKVASGISIAGSTWNLFEGSAGTWAIHSYVLTSNTTTSAFDIMSFVKDLITRKLMPNTRYLTGVEAGVEVRTGTGSGTLTTNSFYCRIQ